MAADRSGHPKRPTAATTLPMVRQRSAVAWLGASITALGCSNGTPTPSSPAPLPLPEVTAFEARNTLVERTWRPSSEQPRRVVAAFFDALGHRSVTELRAVLDDNALWFRPNNDPRSAVVSWQERITTTDYSDQEWGSLVVIEVFDRASSQRLDTTRRFELMPAVDEWLVVVELPRVHNPPPWGTQMQFILREQADGLRISKIWEDFAP